MRTTIFRRALDLMMEARERQARRIVNEQLMGMDDATLSSFGRNRADLKREGVRAFPY